MKTVTSKDGTRIAYEQSGNGPALVLVNGAMGMLSQEMAAQLSPHFTVIDYYRRGRGESGDTLPYAVQREVEDIEALIDAAGGSAYLCGFSSGAALALEAASKLADKVGKAVLFEPPFIVDDTHAPLPDDYVEQLNAAVASGRPGDAVEIFLKKAVGIPDEYVAVMRSNQEQWAGMEKIAHTIAYDGTIMGKNMSGKPLPAGKWALAAMPVLVITGGNSEAFFHNSAKALVNNLPNAEHRVLEGQDHNVAPTAIAPMLVEFFNR